MSSREKELEIVNNATPGPWEAFGNTIAADVGRCTCSGVEPWPGHEPHCGTEEMAQASESDAEFIATFNPVRVRELLDENYEVTRLLAERDVALNYANKRIHRLEARLDAVEELHVPEPGLGPAYCTECDQRHPCDTTKAVRGE